MDPYRDDSFPFPAPYSSVQVKSRMTQISWIQQFRDPKAFSQESIMTASRKSGHVGSFGRDSEDRILYLC